WSTPCGGRVSRSGTRHTARGSPSRWPPPRAVSPISPPWSPGSPGAARHPCPAGRSGWTSRTPRLGRVDDGHAAAPDGPAPLGPGWRRPVVGVLGGLGPLASAVFQSRTVELTAADRDQDHL